MGRVLWAQWTFAEINLNMDVLHNILRLLAAIPRGTPMRCVLCGHRVGKFLSYRGGEYHFPPLMRELELVGSDIENFECPRCGAHDRERHLFMYLQLSGLLACLPRMRALHFAPEFRLSQHISRLAPTQYIKCDLHPTTHDIQRVDIERMPFSDESFDLVIANHILEHVEDDMCAVSEIYRVLRSGGMAILQTPYSPVLHRTWSDPGIVTDEGRRQAYGQEDHVRLFGRDIFDRFASRGLKACIASHSELLPDHDAKMFGVNSREPFFLFRRGN